MSISLIHFASGGFAPWTPNGALPLYPVGGLSRPQTPRICKGVSGPQCRLLSQYLHVLEILLITLLVSAIRRRRVRLNRHRLWNCPWSRTSPCPAKSWFEILYISMFHDRNILVDYFQHQQRMKRGTIQALFGILTPWLTSWERIFDWGTVLEKVLALGILGLHMAIHMSALDLYLILANPL